MTFDKSYLPKLDLTPAELEAFAELPDKDQQELLPIVPLRGWVGSKDLSNSIKKIEDVYGKTRCILDLDYDYVYGNKDFLITGEFPRPVFDQLAELMCADDGYSAWCEFVEKLSFVVPVLQINSLVDINKQFKRLSDLNRGVVLKFDLSKIENGFYIEALQAISEKISDVQVLVILDLGRVTPRSIEYHGFLSEAISNVIGFSNDIVVAITGSSFPDSFAGTSNGENPIYERQLFNMLDREFPGRLKYSDYASARFKEGGGGGGIPSPRIDYPLKNDWRYIRKAIDRNHKPTKEEKKALYYEAANELSGKDYWLEDLPLWGVRMIELTALNDGYGIDNPRKSTAVRINIHLYNQLHYFDEVDDFDTDEEWED